MTVAAPFTTQLKVPLMPTERFKSGLIDWRLKGKRSMNPTYRKVRPSFTVAFPVNSSTATALHNLPPTAHGAAAAVRGAATYRALGR